VRIALATCAAVPPQFDDDTRLLAALAARRVEARREVWDDPAVRWDEFDRVVIRSTWDYPRKHAAFLEWADSLEPRLRNPARLVRWNADKHHLADLATAGIPTVPTQFVEPGDGTPLLEGEIVVKPTVSVGGRDTGRFGPEAHDLARALVRRLQREGRSAMVQPYLSSVDAAGEASLVYIAGRHSHAARKQPVLRRDEEAPIRDDEIGAAEVMYDPDIVVPSEATEREIEVGERAIGYLRERFGTDPLYARVDLVAEAGGDSLVLELEAVEPNLFLRHSPDAADRLAAAILVS
jgi:glutathione synthase/RimK-type ligase-like ATP-grasp enzyme